MEFRIAMEHNSPYKGKLAGKKFKGVVGGEVREFVICEVHLPYSYRKISRVLLDNKCHIDLRTTEYSDGSGWNVSVARYDYAFSKKDGKPVASYGCGLSHMWKRNIDRIDWRRKKLIPPSALVEKIHDLLAKSNPDLLQKWLERLG